MHKLLPKSLSRTVTKKVAVRYYLHLPKAYDSKGRDKWPLILFLHGAGERGSDLQLVRKHGVPKIAEADENFPFIVVAPQCQKDRWWSVETLKILLDEIEKTYRVDSRRIYLTGLSMGGFGTWELAMDQPRRFAAIAPICGGSLAFLAHKLQKLPVWIFHGARDAVVPLYRSQEMARALRKLKAEVKLTVYPKAGHDSWTETYANPALYRWFLKHRRP